MRLITTELPQREDSNAPINLWKPLAVTSNSSFSHLAMPLWSIIASGMNVYISSS